MIQRTRRRRAAMLLAAAAATVLVVSGCGDSSGDDASGGKTVAVSLITKNSTNPFFVAMQNGAKKAAETEGVKLTLAAGKEDGDEASQVQAIEDAIARGDAGILITPNGPGVNPAIKKARDAGLYVIALDTPPDPADTVDITFATDNFKAGELIGKWTAVQLGGKPATIALLDLFSDKIVSVDYNRDQGFLTGMGIDTADKKKNGDEAKTGSYSGGSYTIACNEPTNGAEDGGRTAMENCLTKNPGINVVYTINEPAAVGAHKALQAAGKKDVLVVSVDGGCDGVKQVKDSVIGATSQQYPLKMAELGVQAIKKIATGGEKPKVTDGLDFFDTGVALVTDKTATGVESITSTDGAQRCWG
ncbi:sugar ABC transporter periplasmic sugar-binding protein [Micromonospora sp. ATCC 39149]|uniref:Substrate-binding domain-containing protein n=1 Tax=Micromonospora carbonacea TaxID=47853 RepID=A0A7D5Y7E4_9ACTN|nr:substrate-binding domain-containing protein [Micromonospora sp. ATCC 39149]EEP74714.1 sugar ABC transporter periplasmic sugar-binding protein [Micromonospora sp. ATCC 39149]QLK00513.1 substrate-binding domain-containing protein [Micromonospora carbonacea]